VWSYSGSEFLLSGCHSQRLIARNRRSAIGSSQCLSLFPAAVVVTSFGWDDRDATDLDHGVGLEQFGHADVCPGRIRVLQEFRSHLE
jgi:hypothetical protein